MIRRTLAYSTWILAVAVSIAAVGIAVAGWIDSDGLLLAILVPCIPLAYGTVGLMLVRKAPHNTMGWVFLIGALLIGLWALGISYFDAALRSDWPGAGYANLFTQAIYMPAILSLVVVPLLLFPNGRAPSPGWRWVWFPILVISVMSLVQASLSTEYRDDEAVTDGVQPRYLLDEDGEDLIRVENPLGGSEGFTEAMESDASRGAFAVMLALAFAGSVSSMAYRFRRSRGVERLQIKWLGYSASVAGLGLGILYIVEQIWSVRPPTLAILVALLGVFGIPITTGLAIVRYRLYDIDRLISRTITYGFLIATLGAIYVGGVTVLGIVVPGESGLAISLATLTVATLFNPLRRRIHRAIDRRFFRARYDARAVVDEFSDRLQDNADLESLEDEVMEVVDTTLQPVSAALWVRNLEEE